MFGAWAPAAIGLGATGALGLTLMISASRKLRWTARREDGHAAEQQQGTCETVVHLLLGAGLLLGVVLVVVLLVALHVASRANDVIVGIALVSLTAGCITVSLALLAVVLAALRHLARKR